MSAWETHSKTEKQRSSPTLLDEYLESRTRRSAKPEAVGGILQEYGTIPLPSGKSSSIRPRPPSIALSPDGTRLAISDQNGVRIVSVPDGSVLTTFTAEHGGNVVFSPDGGILVGKVGQNVLHAWNMTDHSLRYAIQEQEIISNFVISANGATLAYICGEQVKLRTLADGAFLYLVGFAASMEPFDPEDRERIRSFVISPDGSRMACSASLRTNVFIWRAPQVTFHPLPETHEQDACFIFSADGCVLTIVGHSAVYSFGSVQVWDLEEERLVRETPPVNTHRSGAAIISPDGRRVVRWTYQGALMVWSLPDGRLLDEVHVKKGAPSTCPIAMSAEKQIVALALPDMIRLWTVA